MRCLSLFSGIGGFDLALQRKGHQIIGACEIDKHARQVYSRHFPGVRIYEDARSINPEELPDFELLVAGFPCQAFSIAGRRLGFEESRGTLFFEIVRIAKQKRPKFLLLENVRGLLSHDNGRTFAVILKTLDEIGYDAEWQVINSKYFVPQNRERIFIIGHLREKGSRQVFPIGQTGEKFDGGDSEEQIANALQCPGHSCGNYRGMNLIVLHQAVRQQERVYSTEGLAANINAIGGGWGAKTGLYQFSEGVRRLTPLECERLQGFPDGWTEGLSDTQRYKCVGNAVTVSVIEYILDYIGEERSG